MNVAPLLALCPVPPLVLGAQDRCHTNSTGVVIRYPPAVLIPDFSQPVPDPVVRKSSEDAENLLDDDDDDDDDDSTARARARLRHGFRRRRCGEG